MLDSFQNSGCGNENNRQVVELLKRIADVTGTADFACKESR